MVPKNVRNTHKIALAVWLLAALGAPSPAQDAPRLSLAGAVDRALQYSPELAAARAEIRAAQGRTMQAAAFAAPELTLSWDAMPAFFKPAGADERSVGISQSFEFPLKRTYRLQALRHEETLAESRLQHAQKLVVARVKHAYFRALLDARQIASLETASAWLEQFAALAASRYAAQNGTYLEVLRARVEKAKLESELIGWRGEAQQAQAALNILLGDPASRRRLLADPFGEPPFGRSLEQEIAGRLPENARLRQAREDVSRQLSLLALARSGYWPDLSLAVTRQRLNGQPPYDANGFSGSRSSGWAIELGFSLPFALGKGPRGEILQARARLDKAEALLAAAEKEVRAAVETAWQKIKTAEAQVGVFSGSLLADSRDQLQAGLELYRLLRIDSWQLLDVLRSDLEVQSEYSRALSRFNLALADLEAAGETENMGVENEE
jgi:cobalt-zinc-cadmium efflux system outer membrane protein